MFKWFKEQRGQEIPMSWPLQFENAFDLNRNMEGYPNFKASSGRLKVFKSQHGIQQLNIQDVKSANSSTTPVHIKDLKSVI